MPLRQLVRRAAPCGRTTSRSALHAECSSLTVAGHRGTQLDHINRVSRKRRGRILKSRSLILTSAHHLASSCAAIAVLSSLSRLKPSAGVRSACAHERSSRPAHGRKRPARAPPRSAFACWRSPLLFLPVLASGCSSRPRLRRPRRLAWELNVQLGLRVIRRRACPASMDTVSALTRSNGQRLRRDVRLPPDAQPPHRPSTRIHPKIGSRISRHARRPTAQQETEARGRWAGRQQHPSSPWRSMCHP